MIRLWLKIPNAIKFIIGLLVLNISVTLCWIASYFITPYIFGVVGKPSLHFTEQLINFIVGFFIFGCIMFITGTLSAPKRMAGIKIIIDGIKSITKGDYNVSLPHIPNNNPFGQIVESINTMAVELNQMEQLRQEFISNVSHEIQSPLTSIRGFARVLQNEQLTQEERLHYLGIIESESMRLAKLSENLLRLTSLESEHHPFEPKTYRLDKQLRNIVLACEPLWVDKAIQMDINLEEIQVSADEDLMSQVWVNLIHNSIKFTPSGGVIQINLKRITDEALVEISDSGVGIAVEDVAFIFERFYKADKSRNRATVGSGLGLAIVKKIMDMHQGEINVISHLGEGTKVSVHLPVS
jgi:two-component system phosphate regulon sensor histidine kinase PhoR